MMCIKHYDWVIRFIFFACAKITRHW
jgi:hypothetical protein